MPVNRNPFGQRLEQELGRIGATQQQFAERIGVSQQTISKWITGETTPRLRHLPRIEEELGLGAGTLSTLLFAPAPAATRVARDAAPVSLAALKRRLGALDPHELVLVESFLDTLFHNRG